MSLSRGVGLGSLGLSNSLPNLGGPGTEDGSDPTTRFAPGANSAWDFINNYARFKDVYYGPLANTPGWSFTRASTGYAQTAAGVLVPFASGELRRTDKGVLIEGAGTNLCLQSQTFGTTWVTTANNTSVGTDAAVAPDGTTTADKLSAINGSAQHYAAQSISYTSGQAYTVSVYAKAGELAAVQLTFGSGAFSTLPYCNFNVSTGVAGTPSNCTATVVALGGGWYRCSITATANATASANGVISLARDNTETRLPSFSSDNNGVYLWGAQVEAASYASSYIPTTTGSATRAVDSLTVTGVSGLTTHSVFAEWEVVVLGASATDQRALAINDGTTSNRTLVWASNGVPGMQVKAASSFSASINIGSAFAVGDRIRVAGRIAENDMQAARNGTLGTADTSAALPTGLSQIEFNNGGVPTFGYLRRAALWTRALSDSELTAVTSA